MVPSSVAIDRTQAALLALLVGGLGPAPASTPSYSYHPRPTILLGDSQRFLALDAWNGVALYRAGDASLVRRFPAPGEINRIAVSPDEQVLVIACSDGGLAAWEVETGVRVWEQTPSQSGLGYSTDACFAQDGQSFVVGDMRGLAVIYQTRTGRRIGAVRFPPNDTDVMSAALSPDGTQGVLIDLGERLFTFDVATGRLTNTGLKGAGPVRYSVDGKHIAFRSNNSGTSEQLRIIAVEERLPAGRDVGQFTHIGDIRPVADGSFLLTARLGDKYDEMSCTVGVRCWPGTGRSEEVWRLPAETGPGVLTDYRPRPGVGVSTDYRLVTQVFDLRTGAVLARVDNSAGYRPRVVAYTSGGLVPFLLTLAFWVCTLAGVVCVLVFVARRARQSRC